MVKRSYFVMLCGLLSSCGGDDSAPATSSSGSSAASARARTIAAAWRPDSALTSRLPSSGISPEGWAPWRVERIALEMLLDPDIKLTTLVGKAGTGKTLLALVAGLLLVTRKHRYNKLLVARPIMPLGRDIGFLPGTADEKLTPWMKPI